MKITMKHIRGITMSAAILLTGCMNDEIEDLQRRVSALETWQETVNNNIGSLQQIVDALQNNDYVTGVTAFDTPEPGGYRITFFKSAEVTIWNGSKGDTGAAGDPGHSPVIGAAQDTDGIYYWTLDGTWLLSGGNKIPVTGEQGASGATPKVAIGDDGYWHISEDGTATGTPPGTGWASTSVKATGDTGAVGPRGEAIFAENGIDNSSDDYVVFTLADGVTTISLPKYKAVGISFTQPAMFTSGVKQEIAYTSTGTVAPTTIRIVDLPAEWTYSVDYANRQITVTPPVLFHGGNFMSEATVLAGVDNQLSAMYALTVKGDLSGVARNAVGALYYEKGIAKGLVYIVNNGSSGSGRVVSFDETYEIWSTNVLSSGAVDKNNGRINMANVYANEIPDISPANSFDSFPLFQSIAEKNPAGTVFSPDATHIWYLPSEQELIALLNVWKGDKETFNTWLTANGGVILDAGSWSSTEAGMSVMTAIYVQFATGYSVPVLKDRITPLPSRVILAF